MIAVLRLLPSAWRGDRAAIRQRGNPGRSGEREEGPRTGGEDYGRGAKTLAGPVNVMLLEALFGIIWMT